MVTTRRVASVLIVLALLGLAALLVVRRALDTELARRAAESRLSAPLAQPVTIGAMRVAMFPVPAVIGSEIVVGRQPETPDLALERIRIVPRIGSLFRGPLTIREVRLEGLSVRFVREPAGRWRFPTVVPAPGGDASSGLVIERVRLTGGRVRVFELAPNGSSRQTSSVEEIQGDATAEGPRLRVSPLRGRVGTADVTARPRSMALDLRGQAVLSPERSAEAIRSVRELTGLRNDRGEVELPLTIRGTIDSPAIGIDVTAAIGRSLKEEMRRQLRRLFERKFLDLPN